MLPLFSECGGKLVSPGLFRLREGCARAHPRTCECPMVQTSTTTTISKPLRPDTKIHFSTTSSQCPLKTRIPSLWSSTAPRRQVSNFQDQQAHTHSLRSGAHDAVHSREQQTRSPRASWSQHPPSSQFREPHDSGGVQGVHRGTMHVCADATRTSKQYDGFSLGITNYRLLFPSRQPNVSHHSFLHLIEAVLHVLRPLAACGRVVPSNLDIPHTSVSLCQPALLRIQTAASVRASGPITYVSSSVARFRPSHNQLTARA